MTVNMMERERIRTYGREDFLKVLRDNDLEAGDHDYLAAIRIPSGVLEASGVTLVAEHPTTSLKLFYVETGDTGYIHIPGSNRIIVINENDLLDYDRISELHSTADAEVYLSMNEPWEAGEEVEFSTYQEWYRDETYTDYFEADENEKGGRR